MLERLSRMADLRRLGLPAENLDRGRLPCRKTAPDRSRAEMPSGSRFDTQRLSTNRNGQDPWRRSTSSSWVPVPPAASWPTDCRKTAAGACWCSKPVATTAAFGSRSRSAMGGCSSTSASIGSTEPRRMPASTGAKATGRAARWSVGRVRSTRWSIAVACRTTSTTGAMPAIPAGAGARRGAGIRPVRGPDPQSGWGARPPVDRRMWRRKLIR